MCKSAFQEINLKNSHVNTCKREIICLFFFSDVVQYFHCSNSERYINATGEKSKFCEVCGTIEFDFQNAHANTHW